MGSEAQPISCHIELRDTAEGEGEVSRIQLVVWLALLLLLLFVVEVLPDC